MAAVPYISRLPLARGFPYVVNMLEVPDVCVLAGGGALSGRIRHGHM